MYWRFDDLGGPWKWSSRPPGAQSWRGWLGSSAWWNSPHKSHTWVAKDFKDKRYLIWQRPTCLCFLILTLSFNLLLHLIPVFLMITSHLAACVSWYNLPKSSGERSKPRLTNTAGTLEGNMLQREHKERLADILHILMCTFRMPPILGKLNGKNPVCSFWQPP